MSFVSGGRGGSERRKQRRGKAREEREAREGSKQAAPFAESKKNSFSNSPILTLGPAPMSPPNASTTAVSLRLARELAGTCCEVREEGKRGEERGGIESRKRIGFGRAWRRKREKQRSQQKRPRFFCPLLHLTTQFATVYNSSRNTLTLSMTESEVDEEEEAAPETACDDDHDDDKRAAEAATAMNATPEHTSAAVATAAAVAFRRLRQ